MAKPENRNATEQTFLDAAERLLVEVGYANITTRRLAEEASANLGLVHYYFGSMEQLFARVLERFTDRLVERQRAMYAAPLPFIEKWRAAMGGELVRAAAALAAVDPHKVGLGDLGKPDDWHARQVSRWRKQDRGSLLG